MQTIKNTYLKPLTQRLTLTGVLLCVQGCASLEQTPLKFNFYDAINARALTKILPTQPIVYRVELPSRVALEAQIKGAASVVFHQDGQQLAIDNEAPFLLDRLPETALNITATAYTKIQGQGKILAQNNISLTISQAGMAETYSLTEAEHQDWINKNLDTTMARKTFTDQNGVQLPYRLFVPPQYSPAVKYPLVVFLHGRGERGTDNTANMFNKVGLFSGPQSIVSPYGQHYFPAIVLVPQCSDKTLHEEWAHWQGNSAEKPFDGLGKDGSYQQATEPSASGGATLALINTIAHEYNVDPARIYITGISMGGFGTWELVSRRPDLFAAAVPMAGYSDPSKAQSLMNMPFWIFHGNRDKSNPVTGSRTLYKLLEPYGNVKYTEIEGAEHGQSFRLAWANTEILPWLFAQRKEE